MKRTFSLILILLALLMLLPAEARAASSYNNNDTMNSATYISLGDMKSSTVGTTTRYVTDSNGNSGYQTISNYYDYYRFSLSQKNKVTINVASGSSGSYGMSVALLNSGGSQITGRSGSCTINQTLDSGTYYILVSYSGSGFADYKLTLDWCLHSNLSTTVVSPTCTVNGYTRYSCSKCGLSWEGNIVYARHSYGSWYTVKEPTCISSGTERRVCSGCNDTESRTLSPVGHKVTSWTVTKEPACTTTGSRTGPCTTCGATVTETISALGHKEVKTKEAVAPTCEQTGLTAQLECSVCKSVLSYQKTVSALGHQKVTLTAVAPTCTETGLTQGQKCSVCEKVFTAQQVIPANGHTEVVDARKEPTCTETGITEGKYCSACKETLIAQETIPALGHDFVKGICTRCNGSGDVVVQKAWGPHISWTVYKSGLMIISGDNVMPDTTFGEVEEFPWYSYRSQIQHIVVQEGVGTISPFAFESYTSLKSVSIAGSVQSIGQSAFYGCSALESAKLSEGITDIGSYVFRRCSKLTEVEIPSTVTGIGEYAFCDCTALESVILHEGLTGIGSSAFENCKNLAAAEIPSTVTQIDDRVFYGCNSLKSVTLPEGISSIKDSTFGSCSKLAGVEIPSTVTSIDDYAFQGCSGLESLILSEKLTSIGNCAFRYCSKLPVLEFPSAVSSIDSNAFGGCTALKLLIFTGKAPVIRHDAFCDIAVGGYVSATAYYPRGDTTWTADVLQDYGGSLTWKAGCSGGHTLVTDPKVEPTCTKTGLTEGSHCSACGMILAAQEFLSALNHNFVDTVCTRCGLNGGGPILAEGSCGTGVHWTLYESGLMILSGSGKMGSYSFNSRPWQNYLDRITCVIIEDGVTEVGSYSFYECMNLKQAVISGGITEISSSLFSGCSGLEAVTLPDGLVAIESAAFQNCSSLAALEIPATVTSIGSSAFSGCSALETVTLPGGIKEIEMSVFRNCTSLREIVIPQQVAIIGEGAFYNCSALEEITLPGGLMTIWKQAFYGCKALKQVTFSGRAPAICSDAFADITAEASYPENHGWQEQHLQNYGGTLTWQAYDSGTVGTPLPDVLVSGVCGTGVSCVLEGDGTLTISGRGSTRTYSLPWEDYRGWIRKVIIEEGVTAIGYNAFENCFNLESVSIADSVSSIGFAAFSYCEKLKEAVIPAGITEIGQSTFSNCSALESVTLPAGLVSIGRSAFTRCSKLKTVKIPVSVNAIGDYAFNGCTALESVTLPDGMETIANGMFQYCESLTDIVIPDTVNMISDWAFYNCKALTDIVIPDTVTTISTYAFCGCEALKQVTFSGSAPAIGSNAFNRVTANVYYPGGDTSWTADVLQNYGGTLTWKAGCSGAHTPVTDSAVAATCTEAGLTEGSHCSVCDLVLVKQDVIPALGHSYGRPTFQWIAEDSCIASCSCFRCSSNTENKTCTVTVTTVDATETRDGKTIYVAAVTFDGRTYTDKKTVIIPSTGHITHTAAEQWYCDGENHWKPCVGCGEPMEVDAHTPGEAATERTSRRCTVCDRVLEAPLGLDWIEDSVSNPDSYLWGSGYYAGIMEEYGEAVGQE